MPSWEKYLDDETDQNQFQKIVRHKKRITLDGETFVEQQRRKEREKELHEEKRTAGREKM